MFETFAHQLYEQIAESWTSDPTVIANAKALDHALTVEEDEDTDPPSWVPALQRLLDTPSDDSGGAVVKLAAAVRMNPDLWSISARTDLEGLLRDIMNQVRRQAGVVSGPDSDGSTPDASSMAATIGRAMAGG